MKFKIRRAPNISLSNFLLSHAALFISCKPAMWEEAGLLSKPESWISCGSGLQTNSSVTSFPVLFEGHILTRDKCPLLLSVSAQYWELMCMSWALGHVRVNDKCLCLGYGWIVLAAHPKTKFWSYTNSVLPKTANMASIHVTPEKGHVCAQVLQFSYETVRFVSSTIPASSRHSHLEFSLKQQQPKKNPRIWSLMFLLNRSLLITIYLYNVWLKTQGTVSTLKKGRGAENWSFGHDGGWHAEDLRCVGHCTKHLILTVSRDRWSLSPLHR